ncbi:MAG: enoyl-CoA hydratase/isomerase family protein, partial [bacterium]|nr:enoyl-CoA hydratase/isomerase family protein [bacterium]
MKPYPTPPEGLQVVSAPPILTLTLDRPQRRNSLTDDIVLALIDTLEAASADEEIRAVLLNATGDN